MSRNREFGRGDDGRDSVRREIAERDEDRYDGAGAASPALRPDGRVERRTGRERRVGDASVAEDRRVVERRVIVDAPTTVDAVGGRVYALARITQGVDYLFYLLYGLLGIRFVLALLGASEQAGFVQFVHGLTNPFYAPFSNIVARPAVNGGMLDFPLLIALLAYALLHLAVRGLLRLVAGARTAP